MPCLFVKVDPEKVASREIASVAGQVDADEVSGMVDMLLPPEQATLLSLLMAYSDRALAERPGDIVSSFGLESLQHGFVAFAVPSPITDLRFALLNSVVVSSGATTAPKFPDILVDPSYMVGKRASELGPSSDEQLQRLAAVFLSPPPCLGKPWIRRFRFQKMLVSQFNKLENVMLEETIFMDGESQAPKWIFCTIVDRLSNEVG